MAKAAKKPTTDADLLAMISRHDALWRRTDEIAALNPSAKDLGREHSDAIHELVGLERRIAATPAYTRKALAGKRRVMKRAAFEDNDLIIDAIIQTDSDRVGANNPNPTEAVSVRYEHIGKGRVRVLLQTTTGETIAYTMSAALCMQSINEAMHVVNENLAAVLADILC